MKLIKSLTVVNYYSVVPARQIKSRIPKDIIYTQYVSDAAYSPDRKMGNHL